MRAAEKKGNLTRRRFKAVLFDFDGAPARATQDHAMQSFTFYEGVREIIDGLKEKGYRLGLVSGANLARLSSSAGRAFLDYYDAVVTAERVKNRKPHPEPYLRAASALGCAPAQCVAVENAPMGIEAAKNAGMRCIAVSSTLDRRRLEGADIVIDDFIELAGLL